MHINYCFLLASRILYAIIAYYLMFFIKETIMTLSYTIQPCVEDNAFTPYQSLIKLLEPLSDDIKLKYLSVHKLDKNLKANNPITLYIPYIIQLAQDLSNEFVDKSVSSLLDYFAKNICDENDWNALLQKHNASVAVLEDFLPHYTAPMMPYSYPIERIAENQYSDKIPHDVYDCCLDSKLFDDVLNFSQQTGYDDYRLLVALDSRIRKKVENCTNPN